MEILQGNINREEYYSVRECAEVLGVTSKTIRNRIESKKLPAQWYEQGKGLSCWLIHKDTVNDIVKTQEVSTVPLSSSIVDEIKAQIRAENEALRAELQEVKETQARIEKALLDRDTVLLQAIRERQEERKPLPWWKRLMP